jgi:3-methyladenine DNA glycosylase AlkC
MEGVRMGTMDELINPAAVDRLEHSLKAVDPALDLTALRNARAAIPGKRLRQRVDVVRDALLTDFPGGFAAAEDIMDGALAVPDFTGWLIWPVTEFVVARAIEDGSTTAFDAGMDLLARLTVRLSSEFAVRDMLTARPERALRTMRTWADDDDEHVRRLASEGSRAYLPWGKRVPWLISHPDATQAILDALHRDPAEYVRRSVANHLNDLSRVDPATVTRIARGWADDPGADTPWVLRHGLRTLVKNADPAALRLLGYTGDNLRVDRPRLAGRVVGPENALTFTAVIANDGDADAAVAIDYSIGFLRASGTISPKTFKLASRTIAPGDSVVVTKTHSFRHITTRTYYPGRQFVTVQANGTVSPPADFLLTGVGGDSSRTQSSKETSHE